MELDVAEIFLDSSKGANQLDPQACSRRHLVRDILVSAIGGPLWYESFNCVPLARLGASPQVNAARNESWKPLQWGPGLYFYSFCSYLHLPSYALSFLFILFVLHFSSGPSSFPWTRIGGTMVRERHRPTFSRRHADSLLPGPPLEAPVRDVTPAEMATKQAQPTTFSSKGSEYQVSERPYSTPSSPSCCVTLSWAIPSFLPEITRYWSTTNEFYWNGRFHQYLFFFLF